FNLSILFTLLDGLIIANLFSTEVFHTALNTSDGGGLIGIFFTSLLVKLFSSKGTIIFLIVTSLIALILLTQKSLYDGLVILKDKGNIKPFQARKLLRPVIKITSEAKNKKKAIEQAITRENTDTNLDEANEKSKDIKILDYAEVRKKPEEASIKEEAAKAKAEVKRDKDKDKHVEESILELEE